MKKKHIRELQRITGSIPKELLSKLMKTQKVAPIVEQVMEEASVSEKVPEEKRQQIKHALDAGYFSKEEEVTNKSVEKKMNTFVEAEIEKSIKAGRLPSKDEAYAYQKKLRKQWKKKNS